MSDGAQSKPTLADTSEEGERCIQGMRDDCSVGQTDDKHSHPPGMSGTSMPVCVVPGTCTVSTDHSTPQQ